MKKIFVDIYLAFNLGDDLFLDILAKRYPDTLFTVNYPGDKYDAFLAQYPNVKKIEYNIIHKILRKFKIYDRLNDIDRFAEDHDALVFLGGSIFREEPYHHNLYQRRMDLTNSFYKKKKKIFVLGANFGPYITQQFIDEYRLIFNMCEDVCFRDSYSYNIYKNMKQIRLAPDIIFQMKNGFPDKQPLLAAFSLVDFRHKNNLEVHQEDYIGAMTRLISFLIVKGYQCRLFSFCESEGDMNTIDAIRARLRPEEQERVTIHKYDGNLIDVISKYAECNIAIAARFHACVLSLMFGHGLYPIIYNIKTANMLRDLGLGELMMAGSEISHLIPSEVFARIMGNTIALEDLPTTAEKQFETLDRYII